MTYNVFGGTLNLAQSINLAYSCLVSLLLLTSSASLTLCSAVFLLLAADAVPSSTSGIAAMTLLSELIPYLLLLFTFKIFKHIRVHLLFFGLDFTLSFGLALPSKQSDH